MKVIIGLPVSSNILENPCNENMRALRTCLEREGYSFTTYYEIADDLYTDGCRINRPDSIDWNRIKREAFNRLQQENLLLLVNDSSAETYAPDRSFSVIAISDFGPSKKQYHFHRLIRNADTVVSFNDFISNPSQIILSSVNQINELMLNRQIYTDDYEFLPAAYYNEINYPMQCEHKLMAALKEQVQKEVKKLSTKNAWRLDRNDLVLQVLFRLTTYRPSEIYALPNIMDIYSKRDVLYDMLSIRYYNTLSYEPKYLNLNLVRDIIYEQALIILRRLKEAACHLALDLFFKDQDQEESCRMSLKNDGDDIYAVSKASGIREKVYFREVDQSIANYIHKYLHYIHTPRADFSYGFFFEGEEYPFSVVGIERIRNRPYKEKALAMYGYDYHNCLEFTRLYSRPGGPKQATSMLSSRAIKAAIQDYMPNFQAGITTHMPTYGGESMDATAFKHYFSLKAENFHRFILREINGQDCYEMLTNRRWEECDTKSMIMTKTPLLPVVELLYALQNERITRLFEIEKTTLIQRKREGSQSC